VSERTVRRRLADEDSRGRLDEARGDVLVQTADALFIVPPLASQPINGRFGIRGAPPHGQSWSHCRGRLSVRSEGWLGCDAECDPNTSDREGHRHHAHTGGRRGGRRVGGDRTVAADIARASAGMSPTRVPDLLCLWVLLIRLKIGASWVDIEAILGHQVSDTTLRARRDGCRAPRRSPQV
jgi:hypothetical protein